jgi:exodeoxyribonuclease-5
MILTEKQQQGLEIAVERYKAGLSWTCISGYAGSGKSTLVKFIVAALGLTEEEVAYVAFTGKAAKVLSQKGCPNATTAHRLLYRAKPKADGTYIFIPRDELEGEYKLIVVDEVSMLPKEMWILLLSHGVYVLACGDPFQLPPINPDSDNHVLDYPHVFLDEIMRQAQDSEIIRLSMHIREGKPLETFEACNEQVMIVNQSELVTGMYEWADQILCATNQRREDTNRLLRSIKGFSSEPQVGDKVISLKNEWDFFSLQGNPLTNGSIGIITDMKKRTEWVPRYISSNPIEFLDLNLNLDDDDIILGAPADYKFLTTGKKALDSKQEYQMNKAKNIPDAPFEFTYGYAITTHKAQGSEWNKVLVFEERFPFDKEEHARWLYTACTRASEKLVIVRK